VQISENGVRNADGTTNNLGDKTELDEYDPYTIEFELGGDCGGEF
jgi:hypothetical protein